MIYALLGASLLAALGMGWGWERCGRLPGRAARWGRGLLVVAGLVLLGLLAVGTLVSRVRSQPAKPAPIDTSYRRNA